MAYLIYRTLRKSGIRWALWRPDTPRVTGASTAQTSVQPATDATESVKAEWNDDAEWPSRAASKLPAVPIWRASTDLTTAFAVLPLAVAAVLAVGVAPLVTIPAAVLFAALMVLRSRRQISRRLRVRAISLETKGARLTKRS